MAVTLQIQSVIYHNEKASLLRALDSLSNAVRVNRETAKELGDVTVCYGDASAKPVFSNEEIGEIEARFAPFFTFRYTYFHENTGTAKGHNRMGRDCTADYMMIMNPDVLVCPHLFSNMLEYLLDPAKEAGMIEARQTPIEHPKEYDRETLETEWASTACAMFSTEMFRAIDGFDEKTFFLYCDDLDFSWRIRLAGKKVYYRPDCPVYHAKRLSATGGWQPTSAEIYFSQEAALLMAYKWSNYERFQKLYEQFSNSDEIGAKVIARFEEMKANNALPTPIDPEGRIARFLGDNYSENRFVL